MEASDAAAAPPAAEPTLHTVARAGDIPALLRAIAAAPGALDARDRLGRSALHLAAFSGQVAAVQMLLNSGAHASVGARDDVTPLHFACQKGHVEVVKALLAGGAGPNARTRKGQTPLHMAAQCGACRLAHNEDRPF